MLYQFETCVLDSVRFEFSRDGTLVHLEPQVFELLHVLVRQPGALVTKDQLVETVWHGLNVSDSTIGARINAARKAVGDSGREQAIIRTVYRRGFQLVVGVTTTEQPGSGVVSRGTGHRQSIQFANSSGGAQIAYASSGSGPPLMRIGHWLSHLEMDWDSPVWQPLITALSQGHTLYRYDQRGTGLSSRELEDVDLDDFVSDLTTVATASGLTRFPLFAASQAVPVAVRFAAKFPERVSGMVLYGGYAVGRALRSPQSGDVDEDTILNLIRAGWGKADSPFVRAFSTLFVPDATQEQLDSLVRMQMHSVSPECAAVLRQIIDRFLVADLLPSIKIPTLVIHAGSDAIQPINQGRLLATKIPNARFVMLESRNHIPLPHEASWPRLVNEIVSFVDELGD